MAMLDLASGETTILIETLESVLSELRMEISKTDQQDFRDGLKERKQVLMNVLEQLRAENPAPPPT